MNNLRKVLIFLTLFIGIGALWGMIMMLIDPSGVLWGMNPILDLLKVLPYHDIFFANFIFSAIILFIVNGATQLLTATLLIQNNKYASRCAIACGIILILWILLQLLVLFGPNPLSIIYLVLGILQTICAILLYRKERNNLSIYKI